MGGWHFGVRSTTREMHDLLRQALARWVVEEGSAPPHFSVQVGTEGEGKSEFSFLFHGVKMIVRTRDVRRLVGALAGHVAAYGRADTSAELHVDALALVGAGGALLAPAALRFLLPPVERRLHAAGLWVVDQPWATVDVRSGNLIVPGPHPDVDWSVVDEFTAGPAAPGRHHPGQDEAPSGRYPVVGWAFGLGRDGAGPLPRAHAAALAGRLLLNSAAVGLPFALQTVATIVERIEPVALWEERVEGLIQPLADLVVEGARARR